MAESSSSAVLAQGADPAAALQANLEAQALRVRELKAAKSPKEEIDKEVELLLSLKKQIAALTLGDARSAGKEGGEKKPKANAPVKFTLKTPKVRAC